MKDFIIGICEALERRTGYAFEYLNSLMIEVDRDEEDSLEQFLVDFIGITLEEDWDLSPDESVILYG